MHLQQTIVTLAHRVLKKILLIADYTKEEDTELSKKIEMLLHNGKSYSIIVHFLGCSRGKIAKVSKRLKQECSVGYDVLKGSRELSE